MEIQPQAFKEPEMPKWRQTVLVFIFIKLVHFLKSLDLEGSWCLVGNLGRVQLAGPLGGSCMHSEQAEQGCSK